MNSNLNLVAVYIQLLNCIPHLIGTNDFYSCTNMKIASP
jgi:hypothetical protein